MTIQTTVLELSTTPRELISTATTWGHCRGACVTDPVTFLMFNDNAIRVRIGGLASATQTGFPVLSSGTFQAAITRAESIFGFTSVSTATVTVLVGSQT